MNLGIRKRLLAGLLAIVSLICVLNLCDVVLASDIKDADLEETAGILNGLGIMTYYSDGTFRSETYVTRGEFVKMAVKLLKAQVPTYKKGDGFSDVSDSNENAPYIYWGVSIGAVRGYGDGTFKPNRVISLEEAVSVLIKELGYGDYIRPENLHDVNKIGLLNRVRGGMNDSLSRANAAQLLRNALFTDELDVWSSEDKAEKGKSLFETVYNGVRLNGTVTDTKYVHPFSFDVSDMEENEMKMDEYTVECSEPEKWAGKSIECYGIKDRNDEKRIKAVYIKAGNMDEKVIKSGEIESSGTKSIIKYIPDGNDKAKTINLKDDAAVVYNGCYAGNVSSKLITDNMLKPKSGRLVLIDNDRDGSYDIIFVYDEQIIIADTIAINEKMVYDKITKNGISFDPDDDVIIRNSSGGKIELKDLAVKDLIKLYKPLNEDGYTLAVKEKSYTVSGTLGQKNDDYITISGEKYELSDRMKDEDDNIKVGSEYTIWLDSEGYVVYADGASSKKYAYIVDMSLNNNGFDNTLRFKLFTDEGEVVVAQTADRIKVFDYSVSDKETTYNSDETEKLYNNIKDKKTLVKYKLNNNKELSEIEFSKDRSKENIQPGEDGFYKYIDGSTYVGANMFNSKYKYSSDTKVICLPKDLSDEKKYSMGYYFSGDNFCDIEVYDVDEDFKAGAVIVKGGESISFEINYGVVKSVEEALGSDGETVTRINIFDGGKEKSIDCDDSGELSNEKFDERFGFKNVKISDLTVGDIIGYKLSGNGELDYFGVVFKNTDSTKFFHKSSGGWSSEHIPHSALAAAYGEVLTKKSNLFTTDINGIKPIFKNKGTYYLYTKNNNKVELSSFDEIEKNDKVVMTWWWSGLKIVLIVR
ncbi:MAG: S-layer homology domain-containing protein [Clostridiales bacterium]|nr:S-layer homology domain-containing protein [Clostridiales bacterium]